MNNLRPKRSNAGKRPNRFISDPPISVSITTDPSAATASEDPKKPIKINKRHKPKKDDASDAPVNTDKSRDPTDAGKTARAAKYQSKYKCAENTNGDKEHSKKAKKDTAAPTASNAATVIVPSEITSKPRSVANGDSLPPVMKQKSKTKSVQKAGDDVKSSTDALDDKAKHCLAKEQVGGFALEERFIHRPGHRFPVHHYKWENVNGYKNLNKFGSLYNVVGDGNCSYYAFMVSFIWTVLVGISSCLYQIYFPEFGTTEQDCDNNTNFVFALRMRQSLRKCLQINHIELTTKGDWALFLDENNRPKGVIGNSVPIDDVDDDGKFNNQRRRDRNGHLCSEFTFQLEAIFDPLYFKNKVMDSVTPKYYLNSTVLLPIITMKYGRSVFFYYLNRNDGTYYTRLYFYRPDDRVQIFDHRQGWYPPFRGALTIYFDGINHYQTVKIDPDFKDYSQRPSLLNGLEESVVYKVEQLHSGSCRQDHSDEPTAEAPVAYDSQKMTLLHTTPIASNRPPGVGNAKSLVCQLEMEKESPAPTHIVQSMENKAYPSSDNSGDPPDNMTALSPDSPCATAACSAPRGDLRIHNLDIDSPLKNAISGSKPKESNPLFRGRERIDATTVVEHYSNNKNQQISVKRTLFDQLVSCTWDANGQTLTGLSWRELSKKTYRAGTIFMELMNQLETFKTHYDPRSKGGARIAAQFDQKLATTRSNPTRAEHDLGIYLDCRCAQNAPGKFCSSTFKTGFKSAEIEKMHSTKADTINLHVIITGDCRHRIGEHTRQCRGPIRQKVIKNHTTLKSGRTIPLDPDAVYNANIGAGEDEDTSLSSRQVAYNMSWESKEQVMRDRGLVRGAYSANFYKAAQEIMEEDLAIRKTVAGGGSDSRDDHLIHGSKHLGVLRYAGYEAPEEGNRCTTPYRCILHSARSVQICHLSCETGRAVLNIDGTKLDVDHGLQIKKDDVVQLWQLILTASFMQNCPNSDDTNKQIRKNFVCKLLSEYHSPHTDASSLHRWLCSFFDMQYSLCGSYHRPLCVKCDCADAIVTAIMSALAFDGTTTVSRLVYNNFMLYVIAHLEKNLWDDIVTSDVLSFTLKMVPTLVSLCRSHVIRAVKDYITSTKRGQDFKDKKTFFKQLIVNLFRRITFNMGISDSIVHVGLAIYIMQRDSIPVRGQYISTVQDHQQSQTKVKSVGKSVEYFVKQQLRDTESALDGYFKDVRELNSTIDAVTNKSYLTRSLIQSVVEKAKEHELEVSHTHCVRIENGVHHLVTDYCNGVLPALPKKRAGRLSVEYDCDSPSEISYVYGITSTVSGKLISTNQDTMHNIVNNMQNFEICDYLRKEWNGILPSINVGILRMGKIGVAAEIDTSNQTSEGKYKKLKHDPNRKLHVHDPGLYLWYWWTQEQLTCHSWIRDLKLIGLKVEKAALRRQKKRKRMAPEVEHDLSIDGQDVPWQKHFDRISEARLDLLQYYKQRPDICGRSYSSLHRSMMGYFQNLQWDNLGIISYLQLYNFLTGKTRSDFSVRQLDAIEEFMQKPRAIAGVDLLTNEEPTEESVNIVSSRVMYDNQLFDQLPDMLQKLHTEWDLLDSPRQLPRAKSELIDAFIKKCEDDGFAKQFCTTSNTFIDLLTLTDNELNGEPIDEDQLMYEVVHERKVLGENFPADCRAITSNFCCVLKMKQESTELVKELNDMLPKEAWPAETDDAETLLKKSDNCMWYTRNGDFVGKGQKLLMG